MNGQCQVVFCRGRLIIDIIGGTKKTLSTHMVVEAEALGRTWLSGCGCSAESFIRLT